MSTYQVSQATTVDQQQAITQAIINSINKGQPWELKVPPGDMQGNVIANNIVTNVNGSIASQPNSSTNTGTSSWWDDVLTAMGSSGGASGVASGVASQAAAAGSTPGSVAEAAGGGNPTSLGQYGNSLAAGGRAADTALDWVRSNLANYGLVILGVVLGVGALLISQKQTILQVGNTVGKVAALA